MTERAPAILPKWMYDLIGAVEQYEDEHAQGHDCLGPALANVPEVERDRAAVIRLYGETGGLYGVVIPADMSAEDEARFRTAWGEAGGGPVEIWRQATR